MKWLSRTVLVGLAVFATGVTPAAAADEFSSQPVSVPDSNTAPDGLPQLIRRGRPHR